MKKTTDITTNQAPEATVEEQNIQQESKWTKQHTLISTKSVDYDNLTAIEAVSMTAVLVLSVMVGILSTLV